MENQLHSQHFFFVFLSLLLSVFSSSLNVFFFTGVGGRVLFFSTSCLIRYWKASSTFQPVQALTTKNQHSYYSLSLSMVGWNFRTSYWSFSGVRRSDLLPKRILGIYFPQCNTSCSIQLRASLRDSSFVISKTTQAAFERLKQLQTMVRYLSWPAESHSSRLKALPSQLTFLNRQSIPMVGFCGLNSPSTQRSRRVLLPTADRPIIMVLKFLMLWSQSAILINYQIYQIQFYKQTQYKLDSINPFISHALQQMIEYQPSPCKPVLLTILAVFFIVALTRFLYHYSPVYAGLVLMLAIAVARAVGTFLMYPCSFRFTKSEIERRESVYMVDGLHRTLLDLQSVVEKIISWDLLSLQRQSHCLLINKVHGNLSLFLQIIQRSARNAQSPSILQLLHTYQRIHQQLTIPIASHPDEVLTFCRLLQNCQIIHEVRSPQRFKQLQKRAEHIQFLARQLWPIVQKIVPNHPADKFKNAAWQLYGHKIFSLDSFFAFWDPLFKYTEFEVPTSDGKVLQCAIIHGDKNSRKVSPKRAVLFCSPNGAFLQSCALSSAYVKFYIKNSLQVILWNYRGYGNSTGTPSILRSMQDAGQIFDQTKKKFKVKIEVVHGFSIGGPCAIHLSKKYSKEVKLLVADRTFSSIDRVPFGFIDRSINYCRKPVQMVIEKIVKFLFYSDCIDHSQEYSQASCDKVCIWATFDEIIYDGASLRQELLKSIWKNKENILVQRLVEADLKMGESTLSELSGKQQQNQTGNPVIYSTQSESQIFQACMSQKQADKITKMTKIFVKTLANLYSRDPSVYRRFAEELRYVDGAGIRMPITLNVNLQILQEKHSQYYIGVICFGPSQFKDKKQLLFVLNQCATKIRQEVCLIAEEEDRHNLGQLVETIQFLSQLMHKYFKSLRQKFGHLIATNSGHNGNLEEEFQTLQQILKNSLIQT